MALVDLLMPKMGESIMEATILKWHKKPGDTIQQDEAVLDIATDKVDSEVPSTTAGVLAEILFQENDVVAVGAVIARIKTGEAESVEAVTAVVASSSPVAQAPAAIPVVEVDIPTPTVAKGRFYSPLVLNIATSEGIPMAELEALPGTGAEGRVTKKDILEYVAKRKSGTVPTPAPVNVDTALAKPAQAPVAAVPAIQIAPSGSVEIIEMDRMRKLIAKHMVDSKHTSPHVTSFTEADVTNLVLWRDKVKGSFEKREGEKITFTPLFVEAIVKCIKQFPIINSSIDGDRILVKKDINIGMATALPSGNLIVPVIKQADQLNLIGITKKVNGLAKAARNNQLKPDDTQGGSFTLTNVGTFGSLMGTPIINQPQVAILAVGAIKKRPVVLETPQGDVIAIRHMMYLSMSYDHRIIDGSIGASFLTAVAKELEAFDPNREV